MQIVHTSQAHLLILTQIDRPITNIIILTQVNNSAVCAFYSGACKGGLTNNKNCFYLVPYVMYNIVVRQLLGFFLLIEKLKKLILVELVLP